MSGGEWTPTAATAAHWVESQISLSQAIVSADSRNSVLCSDHVLATVTGLAGSLCSQLLPQDVGGAPHDALCANLLADTGIFTTLLAHAAELFGLEYLYATAKLNPALPAAMGQLVQSDDHDLANLTREFLGAHVRSIQSLRRQHLSTQDLPGEILATAVSLANKVGGVAGHLDDLRAGYDEAATRMALVRRLARALISARATGDDDLANYGLTLTSAILAELSGMPATHVMLCLVGDRGCVIDLCQRTGQQIAYQKGLIARLPAGAQL